MPKRTARRRTLRNTASRFLLPGRAPSVMAKKEASSPTMNSSITTLGCTFGIVFHDFTDLPSRSTITIMSGVMNPLETLFGVVINRLSSRRALMLPSLDAT